MPTAAALMGVGLPDQLAILLGKNIVTLAGTGTTQALGKVIKANTVIMTTSGGATAFTLSANWLVGDSVQVFNTSATSALLYPPVGSAFDGGSTDASVTIPQNASRTFTRVTTTSWRSGGSVLSAATLAVSGNATVGGTLGVTGLTTLTAGASSGSDITFTAASAGIVLKQGANGRVGTFVANGVTPVTINNTSVAITDAIVISLNTVGGTVGVQPHVATITGGAGFTVVCTATDSSTYNYAIIKNAA